MIFQMVLTFVEMKPNKRYFPLIVGLLLATNFVFAQSEEWEWIKTYGGKNADDIYCACLDNSGNIYTAGYFQGTIDIEGETRSSQGDTDALILKFDKNGKLCWARQAGGDYAENMIITEYAKKIKLDNQGNVIVAGIFAWDATVDNTILKGAGNNDIFILKYTPEGKLIWAKNFGSFGHDYLFDMDIDGTGNIYLSGIINGVLVINSEKTENLEDFPGSATFLAKFTTDGNLSWLRRDKGAAENTIIVIDKNGLIYYGINFRQRISIGDKLIESSGMGDFLIQELNPKGETIWQKKYSSKFNDVLSSLSLASDNSLLVSGKYANIPEFKLQSASDTINDQRTFFSSIQRDGSLSWSVNNSGPSFQRGTMLVGSNDNTYFSTDVFQSDINIEENSLTPKEGWFNSYMAIHNISGKVRRIEFQLTGIISSLIPAQDNSIVIAGSCANNAGIFQHFNPSGGFTDFFIGKKKLNPADDFIVNQNTQEALNDLSLYPNPSLNGYSTLDSKSIKNVDRINITDQEGKLIQYIDNCSLPYRLELFYLTRGTYFISVITGGKITTRQLVLN